MVASDHFFASYFNSSHNGSTVLQICITRQLSHSSRFPQNLPNEFIHIEAKIGAILWLL